MQETYQIVAWCEGIKFNFYWTELIFVFLELQAIGRVHRIGQNKPTTVHRFLIRSTIEERMYKMLR